MNQNYPLALEGKAIISNFFPVTLIGVCLQFLAPSLKMDSGQLFKLKLRLLICQSKGLKHFHLLKKKELKVERSKAVNLGIRSEVQMQFFEGT